MKNVLIILALCFSTISVQAGTFRDDFEDGNLDGWEICDFGAAPASQWKVENGVLTCRRQGPSSAALVFGENEWRNYSIECDAKMIERLPDTWNTVGLDLRVLVPNNGNVVWFYGSKDSQVAVIWSWINFQPALKSEKAFGFQSGQWYRLKGIANENNFEFYIDGKLMVTLSESRLPKGRIGLAIQGCVVQFDNVVIESDDIPDNPQSINSHNKLSTAWGQAKNQ